MGTFLSKIYTEITRVDSLILFYLELGMGLFLSKTYTEMARVNHYFLFRQNHKNMLLFIKAIVFFLTSTLISSKGNII